MGATTETATTTATMTGTTSAVGGSGGSGGFGGGGSTEVTSSTGGAGGSSTTGTVEDDLCSLPPGFDRTVPVTDIVVQCGGGCADMECPWGNCSGDPDFPCSCGAWSVEDVSKTLAVYLPDEPELDCGYPSDCTEEDLARMAYNGMCAEDSVAVFELSVFVGFEPRCMRVRASEPSWTFAVDGPNGSLNEESDSCIVVEAS